MGIGLVRAPCALFGQTSESSYCLSIGNHGLSGFLRAPGAGCADSFGARTKRTMLSYHELLRQRMKEQEQQQKEQQQRQQHEDEHGRPFQEQSLAEPSSAFRASYFAQATLPGRPYSPPLVFDDPALIASAPFPYYSPRSRYGSPTSSFRSPRPVSPIEVRPAATPRTSAGRSKLMAESKKWEIAEAHRVQRSQRGYNICSLKGQWQSDVTIATQKARDERLQALEDSREMHRQLVDEIGREGKDHAEELKRQTREGRQAWKHHGRALHEANENTERVRAVIQHLHAGRRAQAAEYVTARRQAEQEKTQELAELIMTTRSRAEHNRERTEGRKRAASAITLQLRSTNVVAMRERLLECEDEVRQNKGAEEERRKTSRDGVAKVLAPINVKEFKAQERARKAQVAARLRAQSQANLEMARASFDEEDLRKRNMHDAVRRAATDGFGDHWQAAYSSVAHSGTSLMSAARDEGIHGFKHDLPSARSPAGRWLREYAQTRVLSGSPRGITV